MIHEGQPPAVEPTPEPALQLAPETEYELSAAIEHHVQQLLTNFDAYDAATKDIEIQVESDECVIYGKSIKKETTGPRANEDVIACGKNWAMLADGTTGQRKNVSMLYGQAIAETAKMLIPKILERATDNLDVIEQQLAAIPYVAKELLTKLLAQDSYATILHDREITTLDFSTTLDLVVAIPKPQTQSYDVIIIHRGDSRVYLDNPHQPLTHQITQDDKLDSTNTHALSLQTNTLPSTKRLQCSSGDKLALLGDGTYTMRTGIESIQSKLHQLLSPANASKTVDSILQAAENMKKQDDRSAIVIELK